jgi:hypothetical protein
MIIKFAWGMLLLFCPILELALFHDRLGTWTPKAWFTLYRMALIEISGIIIMGMAIP